MPITIFQILLQIHNVIFYPSKYITIIIIIITATIVLTLTLLLIHKRNIIHPFLNKNLSVTLRSSSFLYLFLYLFLYHRNSSICPISPFATFFATRWSRCRNAAWQVCGYFYSNTWRHVLFHFHPLDFSIFKLIFSFWIVMKLNIFWINWGIGFSRNISHDRILIYNTIVFILFFFCDFHHDDIWPHFILNFVMKKIHIFIYEITSVSIISIVLFTHNKYSFFKSINKYFLMS